MSPLSRGLVRISSVFCVLFILGTERQACALSVPASKGPKQGVPSTKSPKSPEEIEAFVKTLEYEATNGGNDNSLNGLVKVELDLLDGESLAYDVVDGLQEEFEVVDANLGETPSPQPKERPGPTSRQLTLIYQGVYAPDSRFNAFADGVMVNMVAEMKRKRMDPLYFRVYDRGVVEHVAARAGRAGRRDEPTAVSSVFTEEAESARQPRQRGNAIGGGVIRGLTNTKRFGNAEVQIAGNTTLVRSHYVFGPLNIELVFHTEKGVKTINSTLGALAAHAVAGINDNSSKLIDFIIDSPAEYEIHLVGARSRKYQRISQSAITRIFKPTGTLERRLKQQFIRSRARKIPDVTQRRRNEGRRRNNSNRGSNRQNGENEKNASNSTTSTTTPDPKLP